MQTAVVVDFLSDEDECVSDPCQHDSKCYVDGTSYKCECTGAWEGTTCSSKCYYGDSLLGFLLLRAKEKSVISMLMFPMFTHSRPQRPRSFILVPRSRAPFGQHQESRPLARSNTGSPRFTDFPSLCACLESSLTNLIGCGLNLLCLQSHLKTECR